MGEDHNEVNLASKGILKQPPRPDVQNWASLPSFSGDGSFLTPRMRKVAEKSREQAMVLAGETLSVEWFDGEPGKDQEIQKKREIIRKKEEEAKGKTAKGKRTEVIRPNRTGVVRRAPGVPRNKL